MSRYETKVVDPSGAVACWACSNAVADAVFFCPHCGKIQPPSATDYFSVFSLQPRLNLDLVALEREFHHQSRKLHPDRFARASAQERQWSTANTALLNDAWRTLKDPLRRTEYLLSLRSAGASELTRESRVSADLLEEAFDLNMQLEELRAGRNANLLDSNLQSSLQRAKQKFEDFIAQTDDDLRAQWNAWDEDDSAARANAEAVMANLLSRRRYLSNLLRKVNRALGIESGTE